VQPDLGSATRTRADRDLGAHEQRTFAHPAQTVGVVVAVGRQPHAVVDNDEQHAARAVAAKQGSLSIRIGLGWAKSHSFTTGQCPVMRYHRKLMNAILNERCQIAKAVNAAMISLDDPPQGYQDFDKGAAVKFVLDPHGMLSASKRIGA
jgi:glutathione-independent formaldehyde dehydrogenase